jgi:preprotein translocase subunit SecE
VITSSYQALISVFILKKGGRMKKIKTFFKDVKKELNKVKWPSKKNMVKYSVVTVVFIIFFALFFTALDLIIAFVKTLGA